MRCKGVGRPPRDVRVKKVFPRTAVVHTFRNCPGQPGVSAPAIAARSAGRTVSGSAFFQQRHLSMRPIASRLAVVVLATLCTAAAFAARPTRASGAPGAAGEIRVHARPGGSYARMEGDSVAVLRLLRCPPSARDERGRSAVSNPAVPTVARNAVGDWLEIPAGAGPAGMSVEIARRPMAAFRQVEATADAAVSRARLTIDVSGCEMAPGMTIVLLTGGNSWSDVGGTVDGTAITADLPHLSIYAVAGN
jgi:hypothetical protein